MSTWTRVLGSTAVAVAVMALSSGLSAHAQLAQQTLRISGRIAEVDAQKRMLKLAPETAGQREQAFAVDAQTKITEQGQPATLTQLGVGEKVTIEYVAQEGKNIARNIKVEAASGGAGALQNRPGASGSQSDVMDLEERPAQPRSN